MTLAIKRIFIYHLSLVMFLHYLTSHKTSVVRVLHRSRSKCNCSCVPTRPRNNSSKFYFKKIVSTK